jgi:hypothetical protein
MTYQFMIVRGRVIRVQSSHTAASAQAAAQLRDVVVPAPRT